MDWKKVEDALELSFDAEPERVFGSLVVHRRTPLDLGAVLESVLAEGDRDDGDISLADPGDVYELLEKHDAYISLLGFYWESLGPMSWVAGVALVGTGRRRYLGIWDETESYRLVASVEPWDHPLGLAAAVSSYVTANGQRHGDGLFGSLPHEVTNQRPDLLSAPVVKKMLFEYMEWAESVEAGAWSLLASEHYSRMVEPNHLQRSLDLLETFSSLDLDEIAADSEAMSQDARRRLFDEWFASAYSASEVTP